MWKAGYRPLGLALVTGFAAMTAIAQERQDIGAICGDCRVEVYAECGGFLEGATFDRSGRLWAVDLLSGNILRIDENRQCRVVVTYARHIGDLANGPQRLLLHTARI